MPTENRNNVDQFLKDYPGMSIRPSRDDGMILKGAFKFCATPPDGIEICDSYELEMFFPASFPREIPKVKELGGKIPRDGKYHINSDDDTLCLGSPLRLLREAKNHPSLTGFSRQCIVPFLYAVSKKLQTGGDFVFSELAHGKPGVIDDYKELLGLSAENQVRQALKLLGMKRRISNKLACPCNCGKRLGSCHFHRKINEYRKVASRSWFKMHSKSIGVGT